MDDLKDGESTPHNPKVVGSNPTPATKLKAQVRALPAGRAFLLFGS
jgi:hypothetical protein